MSFRHGTVLVGGSLLGFGLLGCGSSSNSNGSGTGGGSSLSQADVPNPLTNPADGVPAGNASGGCAIPTEAAPEDVSSPRTVVGTGTAASCTGEAVVAAVAKGGVITFNCGSDPVVITLTQTAKVVNDTGPKVVLDGGGKVTLSGAGKVRILYMNTCDEKQKWTTPHCNDQPDPQLTVQNLTFVDGNSKAETTYDGGGAIWVRGGRFKVINSRFFNNVCAATGPDVGGGAIRVFDQSGGKPVYIVNSTFGGKQGMGNIGSNGGALSSIGVSYAVINSNLSYNEAIGNGMNPATSGTPGGGSGGAIYNDGNTFTLSLCGTTITSNKANELGGAVFFVSNDLTGAFVIDRTTIKGNQGRGNGSHSSIYAEVKDKQGNAGFTVTGSTVE